MPETVPASGEGGAEMRLAGQAAQAKAGRRGQTPETAPAIGEGGAEMRPAGRAVQAKAGRRGRMLETAPAIGEGDAEMRLAAAYSTTVGSLLAEQIAREREMREVPGATAAITDRLMGGLIGGQRTGRGQRENGRGRVAVTVGLENGDQHGDARTLHVPPAEKARGQNGLLGVLRETEAAAQKEVRTSVIRGEKGLPL